MAGEDSKTVERWNKRIEAAKKVKESWEKDYEIPRCYQYWRGNQLQQPYDEYGDRRIIVNRIHADVRSDLPSLYYYNPFARVTAAPEKANDQGETVDDKAQLLQDTANSIVREPDTGFRENTLLALKESQWAFGLVEVGYSAVFEDNPLAEKPPLKEKETTEPDTATPELGAEVAPMAAMPMEQPDPLAQLEQIPKSEGFYVKHIPAKQVFCSPSDLAITPTNDWIGYYEDFNLQDVKRASAYMNTADLKATGSTVDPGKPESESRKDEGDRVRLWKIWDLRTKQRWVFAEGNDMVLLNEPFERLPLKFLRFDVDPNHFYPIPPIYPKLGEQDEYNDSREFLRLERKSRVARFTYDQDAIEPDDMRKLESGDMGIYVPRKGSTVDPITPINQPAMSDTALRTLTLSEKEMSDVAGSSGSPQVAQTKTATQAVIRNTKDQVQDSFDRSMVADWLSEIIEELTLLACDHLLMDRWIQMNVDPDSMFVMQEAGKVMQQVKQITRDKLNDSRKGLRWSVKVDVESLSPVSEQEKAQQWLNGLQIVTGGNPGPLLASSPELLKRTFEFLGMKSQRDIELIQAALQQAIQIQMQQAAMGAPGPGGMAPQPGQPAPPPPVSPQGPQNAPPGPPQNMSPGAPPPGGMA